MKLASHNSLSYAEPQRWWGKLINFTSKCQSMDVIGQYEYGVRLFDIRIRREYFGVSRNHDVKSAHGLITYFIYVTEVLAWLNEKSTKDDPVYIQLNLENKKTEEDRDYSWFKNFFKECSKRYSNLIFCGGYVKHPWHKIIDCEDPTIDQKNWEFMDFTWQPTMKEKIKRFFVNLFHFSPKYWAKKNNQEYKSTGTSTDFLMLDYIQYGRF